MKSNADLLEMYKEEKSRVIGDEETRTGLEAFPAFADWKAQYAREYEETHETVTVEEADARAERTVEEAEEELYALVAKLRLTEEAEPEPEEEDEVDEAPPPPVVEKPARPKPTGGRGKKRTLRKKVTKLPAKKKAKKKVAKKAPAKKKVVTKKKVTARKRKSRRLSKVQKAHNIFDRFYGRKSRAEIIDKFVAQCDLSPAGAATYYQRFKSGT